MVVRTLVVVAALLACAAVAAADPAPSKGLTPAEKELVAKIDTALSSKPTKKPASSDVPEMKVEQWQFGVMNANLFSLRVGIQAPAGKQKADVFFFHGFADCILNHGPLFAEWVKQGFRVVAFDLPSHGGDGGVLNNINLWTFEAIGRLARVVEEDTRSGDVPLFLAGWSTGGLIGVRMLQGLAGGFARPVKGAFLIAPGVSVHPLVGNMGVVTQDTITNNPNPPHKCPIKPKSPLLTPVFASFLLANSIISRVNEVPKDIPVFMTVAGDDDDKYVKSADLIKWAKKQTSGGAKVMAVQCSGSKHEMDNEPAPVGPYVVQESAKFLTTVLNGGSFTPSSSGPCKRQV